eukprot:TRINITY_DN50573_c0_g1_i3.p1 TRINITY_DN50573_c0_g1~~TRINITY_DN50573_c0_g1_i3.p1  ORF type:complete len:233 (-),score=61.08 TRINITY_DN50573_c0_g1_i3:433-1131(-)
MPLDSIPNIAANCFKYLEETSRLPNPVTPLSLDQIQEITEDQLPKVRVYTPDTTGEAVKVAVTSYSMTCEEVCKYVSTNLKLDSVRCSLVVLLNEDESKKKEVLHLEQKEAFLAVYTHLESQKRLRQSLKYRFCLHIIGATMRDGGHLTASESKEMKIVSADIKSDPRDSMVRWSVISSAIEDQERQSRERSATSIQSGGDSIDMGSTSKRDRSNTNSAKLKGLFRKSSSQT